MLAQSALMCALLMSTIAPQGQPFVVDQPLPELRLPTLSGQQTVDLSEFRGKRLLLIEFASW